MDHHHGLTMDLQSQSRDICRICCKPNKPLVNIFHGLGKEKNIYSKIKECLPKLEITPSDNHSRFVCYKCLSSLETNSEFCIMAYTGNNFQHMQKIKNNFKIKQHTSTKKGSLLKQNKIWETLKNHESSRNKSMVKDLQKEHEVISSVINSTGMDFIHGTGMSRTSAEKRPSPQEARQGLLDFKQLKRKAKLPEPGRRITDVEKKKSGHNDSGRHSVTKQQYDSSQESQATSWGEKQDQEMTCFSQFQAIDKFCSENRNRTVPKELGPNPKKSLQVTKKNSEEKQEMPMETKKITLSESDDDYNDSFGRLTPQFA